MTGLKENVQVLDRRIRSMPEEQKTKKGTWFKFIKSLFSMYS
jgi:hypothetical protein